MAVRVRVRRLFYKYMTALADVVRGFAQLMVDRRGTDLDNWITQVRSAELAEA